MIEFFNKETGELINTSGLVLLIDKNGSVFLVKVKGSLVYCPTIEWRFDDLAELTAQAQELGLYDDPKPLPELSDERIKDIGLENSLSRMFGAQTPYMYNFARAVIAADRELRGVK